MSVDVRSRQVKSLRDLPRDEMLDSVLPQAVRAHGDLAGRGADYKQLPALGFDVDGRAVTLDTVSRRMTIRSGLDAAGVVARLSSDALSDLLQDNQSTMGLAMTSRVKITAGNLNDWISWEPALRALIDGRKVHETGDVTFVGLDGSELDLRRTFTLDDDHQVMANFLEEAGFLHIRGVFEPREMAAVGADIDEWIERATPDDGESWWATDQEGVDRAVRVLFFDEKSEALRSLLEDDRYQWIGGLTGDGHQHPGGAEGLVKPLGIVRGLSDLPWHKDCGQGRHSYVCSGLTCGISVTGADRKSGALGVIPGSHRANTWGAGRDPDLDLQPLVLETTTGDVTVHCSDTLHRAHPPVDRPRQVVYSSFRLPPLPGDEIPPPAPGNRLARAALSDAQSRIESADNEADPGHYKPGRGH